MAKSLGIKSNIKEIDKGLGFIQDSLKSSPLDNKKINKALLLSEETMLGLIDKAKNDSSILIEVKSNKINTSITLISKCEEFKLEDINLSRNNVNVEDLDDRQSSVINSLVLNAYKDRLNFKYRHGINRIKINAAKEDSNFKAILLSILLGVVTALILKLLNFTSLNNFLSENVFTSITQLFMNAITMVVGPLVFFSVAESLTKFDDYSSFGRIGAKVIGMYLFTTVIAIFIGFTFSAIFKPGNPEIIDQVLKLVGDDAFIESVDISLRNTIINIVPNNFFSAFAKGDMMQIIFVAIIIGMASNAIGEYSAKVQKFIRVGSNLFINLTGIILKFNPIAVFSIMANVVLCMELDSFVALGHAMFVVIISVLTMMCVYLILLKFVGKISLKKFFKHYRDTIITAFSSCSSNAAVPFAMKSLDKLGVQSKLYAFSLPLGATINMDGVSILLTIVTVFFARIFSIQLTLPLLFNITLLIVLISVGIPAITGAIYAASAILLAQLGIPASAVMFIAPVATITDFFVTTNNVMGDSAVTILVARSENMIDDKD